MTTSGIDYYTVKCNSFLVTSKANNSGLAVLEACPPKQPLEQRPLITSHEARNLVLIFKVLSNDSRLRLLHALVRSGELCVTELAEEVGMKPQAVSNQLQRLTDRGIVETRRDGNKIYYRIVDPCVISLLDQGMCLTEDAHQRRNGGRRRP